MAIKGPKGAIPTLKGWVSPKGELLKAQKMTQEQIDEWNGKGKPAPVKAAPPVEKVIEVVEPTQDEESDEASVEDIEEDSVVEEPAPVVKRRSLATRFGKKK
jgi:hypothetical protein